MGLKLSDKFKFATLLSSCQTTGEIIQAMADNYDLTYRLTPTERFQIVAALSSASFLPLKLQSNATEKN